MAERRVHGGTETRWGRRFWRVGFCTRVEAAAVDGGRGEVSRRYLKGRPGASACGSRRGLGGAWPGRTRARVRLGREEGEGPDRWGPPTGGREGGRIGTGRDRGDGPTRLGHVREKKKKSKKGRVSGTWTGQKRKEGRQKEKLF